MKLIVGLGNPGKDYDNTRHNIGFMVIDNYLENATWQQKFNALYTTLNINSEKVYFIKPQTYMNLSGNSVAEFANFFKVDYKDILVIHDNLDLPLGKYRVKIDSSAGGHNGIKSIIDRLGTNSFARLKIGISHNKDYDTKDYVLGHFNKEEQDELNKLLPTFNKIINSFINDDIKKVMNDYNGIK